MIRPARELFELPDDIHYLNCAYMAPLARPVRLAGEAGVRRKARPWEIGPEHFFEETAEVRALFGRLLGDGPDGIAIVPAVSYGVAVAAANLPPLEGDVLVLDEQFPSNVYAWRVLAERSGRSVTSVPRPADGDWTAAVLDRLDRSVGLLAVPQLHWADGGLLDLVRIGAAARDVGARLVLDLSQSLGALPFDVADVLPDFVVCAGYKWLLGPYSYCFLYAAPEHRGGQPIEHGWLNRAGAEDFASLVRYTDQLAPGARRYDVGETANFALAPMARAALELLHEWTPSAIRDTVKAHTTHIAQAAESFGMTALPPQHRAPHYLALTPQLSAADARSGAASRAAKLRERLARARVYVSVRGDRVRISPHVYNDARDVGALLDALEGAVTG